MDLFEQEQAGEETMASQPLAARMRPQTLDDIVGQDHILGPERLLRRVIEADRLGSMILYGPPGCGKTSLAEVIARTTERHFERASGVVSNVATLRSLMAAAEQRLRQGRGTILFIDEIHRFNKAQQDVLLPAVESGTVTLIGATTHNPAVFVNSPLTSRSLVFELKPLDEEAVCELIRRALDDEQRGLGGTRSEIADDAAAFLARICEGDARRALTALEVAVLSTHPRADGICFVDAAAMEACVQRKMVVYDRGEDQHYDTISAFIKSVRGSDADAAVYWLAKMLYAGEDPRFVARRLMILASEDIGNADPRALTLATSAMQSVEIVGMPEARIILSQVTCYLATAPKSNASYLAVNAALADVKEGRVLRVPEHLRNVRPKTANEEKEAGDYRYPHDFGEHFVKQNYLPASRRYYEPTGQGYEDVIRKRIALWDAKRNAGNDRQTDHSAGDDRPSSADERRASE